MENPQQNIVNIQHGELSLNEITNSVMSPSCGAVSTFIGTTRNTFNSKKVLKLSYETYQEMAIKKLNVVCEEIRAKWNVHHIAISHRIGDVPVGQASVIIAISSVHRPDSLQAVQFAIDELKATVPIWKKEVYKNGDAEWKENKEFSIIIGVYSFSGGPKLETMDSKENVKRVMEKDVKNEIDLSQVQIRATPEELNRRIQSFINRKRQQVNLINIQEFCSHANFFEENESSCARVDAILIRRKDSKSHVKVHRVFNPRGPQTMNTNAFTDENDVQKSAGYGNSALEERLSAPEEFLGIKKPIPRDIYERIKNIEDRILHLESISPEYKDFYMTGNSGNSNSTYGCVRKRTYSTTELDTKLLELENKYAKRLKIN